jgi:acetyl-CoA acetyltransferase
MESLFPPDRIQEALGLVGVKLQVLVSKSGAGIVASLGEAKKAIDSGRARVVLSYFGVDWGTLRRSGLGQGPADLRRADIRIDQFERAFGYWPQVVWWAGIARRYLTLYQASEEDLAAWAVATRENACAHPYALERAPLTLESYFQSAYIAAPLRRPDCSLINDGAGAVVIASNDVARSCKARPIEVVGCSLARAANPWRSTMTLGPEIVATGARESGRQVFAETGLKAADIDFAEIYDCFSAAAMVQLEELGLCEPGQAGRLAREGDTLATGKMPVNTHGGLLSNSYVLGIGHVVEAVRQLRHSRDTGQVRGARLGLVAGYGGWEHATAILARG